VDIQLIDVTVRIFDDLGPEHLRMLESDLRAIDGVVSTHSSGTNAHMLLVEFNPERTTSTSIIDRITQQGINAELAVPQRL
jgi:hypothetical protein